MPLPMKAGRKPKYMISIVASLALKLEVTCLRSSYIRNPCLQFRPVKVGEPLVPVWVMGCYREHSDAMAVRAHLFCLAAPMERSEMAAKPPVS